MQQESTYDVQAYRIEEAQPVQVGPGCVRRDLPGPGARSWIVEIEAGAEWPHIDTHDENGEIVYVISGELIEGERRFGPGSYLVYPPHSAHRPRSERGVRLFGFNIISAVK